MVCKTTLKNFVFDFFVSSYSMRWHKSFIYTFDQGSIIKACIFTTPYPKASYLNFIKVS